MYVFVFSRMKKVKCVLVGDAEVGKTYAIMAYYTKKCYDRDYIPTVNLQEFIQEKVKHHANTLMKYTAIFTAVIMRNFS